MSARAIERFNERVGAAVAWLTLAMVLVTVFIVIARKFFDAGWIWLQESVTWMHAAVLLLASAYTLAHDEHVRVDIFYRNFSPRMRAAVDATGTLLFLLPVTGFIFWTSLDYVSVSWQITEGSREAGGLPFPMTSLMKSFIPAAAFLLLLQGIAILLRCLAVLGWIRD